MRGTPIHGPVSDEDTFCSHQLVGPWVFAGEGGHA